MTQLLVPDPALLPAATTLHDANGNTHSSDMNKSGWIKRKGQQSYVSPSVVKNTLMSLLFSKKPLVSLLLN